MTAGLRPPGKFCTANLLIGLALGWCCWAFAYASYALEPREYAIEVSAEALSSPFSLRLSWESSAFARTYTIRRRVFRAGDWGTPIATLPAGSTQFTDTGIVEGTAYEYEIQLETTQRGAGGWVNAYGYILAGGKVLWPDAKGKVLVVVDAIAASSLSNEIGAFLRDLTGAGWNPIRRDIARTASVPDVKNLIRAEYNADPENLRSIILLGHVPVPYSGNIAPDLHETHRGAWPADVYYADVDGNWTDSVVNIDSGDYDANDNWIGDGRFDQSQIPSEVELEIGRIDFYDLPAFGGRTQSDLLGSYLQRNSQFRHRAFTAARRMLIRDNFGDLSGDAPAVDAWRHYRQFFGPASVREVGPGGFFGTLQNESFLWAYGCGGGGNIKADGVGTTTDFATQSPLAVFMILHGSYFGDWNTKDNFLRAAVGSAGYPLASIWSGLPHWFMHPMGLGRSVGFVTRLAQNNVNNYKSHLNFAAQQVHISLIGDPTLENFPVIPPRNLSGTAPGNVELNWVASTDENIVGYHVYYASGASGPFQRITTAPVSNTSYSHAVGTGTHHYMVRAAKLERTGSGSFYNLSQGIFTAVTKSTGGALPQVNISILDGDASETGPNNGSFRITRSFADANSLRVEILPGGTAHEGVDFTAIGNFVTIPASATEVILNIIPISDNLAEGSETVIIQIRPSASYTVGSAPSGALSIADGINHPPTISQLSDQTVEAGTSSSDLAFQIADRESAASALQVRARSSNEQLLPLSGIFLGGAGSTRTVRISPSVSSGGTVTVTIIASDGVNETSSSFNVVVLPPNQSPAAIPQALDTYENEPLPITLSGQDPEGQAITFAIQVPPGNGSLSGTPPNLTYLPGTNYFGTDVFSFTVNDGKLASAPAEVSIRIIERNKPPFVAPVQTNLLEDTILTLKLTGTDPNGDHLQYEIVMFPTNGILTVVTNGAYQYYPATNFNGFDSFSFRAFDGEFYSSAAKFELTILGTNDVPIAVGQQIRLVEDEVVQIPLTGSDVDSDALIFELVSSPANGVLSGTLPHLVYRPRSNFFGFDEFRFFVRDGTSTSVVATVGLTVEPVNDAPQLEALANVSCRKNGSVGPIALEVSDAETPLLELQFWAESSNVDLIPTNRIAFLPGDTNRQVTLWPAANVAGQSAITVHVSDGSISTATQFLFTVTNTVPTARDEQIDESIGTVVIPVSRLLANDSDLDQEPVALARVFTSSLGRSVVFTNSTVIYFGSTNSAQDSFRYEVKDGSDARATATVWLTLTEDPRITSLDLADGNVRLNVVGKANSVFRVLSSADGLSWDVRGTGTCDEMGRGEFTESGGANAHHRFYRTEWP